MALYFIYAFNVRIELVKKLSRNRETDIIITSANDTKTIRMGQNLTEMLVSNQRWDILTRKGGESKSVLDDVI